MRRARLALSAALPGFVCLAVHATILPMNNARTSPAAAVEAQATWAYGAFGSGIGISNFVFAKTDHDRELLCGGSVSTFGGNDYWYALRWSPTAGAFEQVFVSELMPSPIVRIASGDVLGDSRFEIVLALQSGEIRIYDQDTKAALPGFSAPANVEAMVLADLDGDGRAEILLTTDSALDVYDGAGNLSWSVPNIGGTDIAVGQMDDDPTLEIATTSGHVVDVATRTIQWHWPSGFGFRLRAADIDGDGRDELIAAENWYFVWAYDVERQLPKWSIPTSQDIGAIDVVDVDCDGVPDLLVGQDQWGSIIAFDTVTQQQKWAVPNPEHGVTNVAVGDVDGDGRDELIWGAGATSTGPDHVYVVDLATQAMKWSNPDLVGPFVGTVTGDIDGDGRDELIAVTTYSDAGYGGGRILVFDAETLALRAVSDPVSGGYDPIGDLKLRDVDGSGKLRIVIAFGDLYDGVIRIFDFDGATNAFTLVWENPDHPFGSPFLSVEIADVDQDGQLEVVAGGSRAHTGAAGVFVYVYDYATGALEWNSFQLGSYWSAVRDVVVETAGGGHPDIVAIDDGSLYAFDGVTKEALQITPGSFTVLRPDPYAAGRALLLGDASGVVTRFARGATQYDPGVAYDLGLPSIDGVTPVSSTGALVGAGGRLSLYPDLSAAPAWTSPDFGAPSGRLASLGAGVHRRFFTGTLTGVVEVAPRSTLTSVVPSSGPASGGTSITVTGSGFQDGAGLFVGDAAATGLVAGGDTQLAGVAPALPPGTLQAVTVLDPDTSLAALDRAFFADFSDLPAGALFHDDVEAIFRHGVTAGCGLGNYCVSTSVTRAQMAVFLVRAVRGADFPAPRASGRTFTDVACGTFAAAEIEWIAAQQITAGCGGPFYCPGSPVTREQMAVFLLKAQLGSGYVPPPATGIFGDVPASDPFAPWIEDLAVRGIAAGCGGGNFCPDAPTTRGQMAALVNRTFFAP